MNKNPQKKAKLVIGLTGGVGAGKSTVTEILKKEYGALILEADRICNKLTEPEGSAYQAVTDLLGRDILLPGGAIDKGKMAAVIFQNPEILRAVNRILHPATFEAVRKRIQNSRKKLIVYESAIPSEARFSQLCQKVLYVYASPATRRDRLKASRAYSEEKIRGIMRSQPDEAFYYSIADAVVNNDGDAESCRRSLKKILSDWGIEALS